MKYLLRGKRVAVIGLGLEGKDLVKFLLKKGAEVHVFDVKSKKEVNLSGIDRRKIKLTCGKQYLASGLDNFDIIFRSPGVKRNLSQLIKAEKAGVEVSSATKIFFSICPAKIIGVTGTKGKGTTSTLIYKILKASGEKVFLAGNIGKPYLALLPKLNKNSWVILELSSFQLIDLSKSPHIAVVLNVTLDHLDWHKDRKEYVDAKKNVVKHQTKSDFAVINYDYSSSRNFSKYTEAKVNYFSRSKKANGCFVDRGKLILSIDGRTSEIGDTKNLRLRGKHNWENVTAAICTARLAGANISSIKEVVFSFKGLEHRLEFAGKVKGVSFYNDSFSTNPQPTIAAVKSFVEPITLILGGSDKGLKYQRLAQEIVRRKNVNRIIIIGEIAYTIKKELQEAKFKGAIIHLGKSSMEKIVRKSLVDTPKGGVIILSPATASFDMFDNYKERGDKFKKAVKVLARTNQADS